MIAAGYPADFVIPLTVRALNGVYGRTVALGTRRPPEPEFMPLVDTIRRIQASRSFSMRFEMRGKQQVAIGVFAPQKTPELQRDLAFVRKTLRLVPNNDEIILDYGALPHRADELAVLSRLMIEIMNNIATDVEVPAQDVSAGRTYANAESGSAESLSDASTIRIYSGSSPPSDAFTSVHY